MTSGSSQTDEISVISNPSLRDPSLQQSYCYCPIHQNYTQFPSFCMPTTCARHQRDYPWPFTQNCLHGLFLVFFIIFLIVGVALTCLGFMNYGHGTGMTKTFKILGIFALLLCIGFLIAACVIVSECLTSAIKRPGSDGYQYDMLFPSYSESLASARMALSDSQYSWNPSAGFSSFHSQSALSMAAEGKLHMCPSCSCHTLRHATSSNDSTVRFSTELDQDGVPLVEFSRFRAGMPSYSEDPETDMQLQEIARTEREATGKEWV